MTTIITRLIGGLGNQLFQYAAARSLALKHGAEVKLDLSGFERDGLRRYELGSYPIAAAQASAAELAVAAPASSGLLARIAAKLAGPRPRHYREAHFHFDPGLARQRPALYMDGYWQSERYFADIANTLRRELTPRDDMEPENARIAEAIGSAQAVSLHVRRGDYVANAHTNAYHGVCSLHYYYDAVASITAAVPEAHFFVFSDDHAWTRENLDTGRPTTFVEANQADRGFRDMQLMSMCKHHIIANSSFSWWGAWLNPSPSKVVICPTRWFAGDDKDTSDLIPSAWVRL
jgi:hypothetical protein